MKIANPLYRLSPRRMRFHRCGPSATDAPRRHLMTAIWMVAGLVFLLASTNAGAQSEENIMCAGNVAPPGMVITATGTAPSCSGSCQARKLTPACGVVLKICAGQPVPKGYEIDGVTSTPACDCLGREDNAYVIRYQFKDADGEEADPLREQPADPTEMSAEERSAINDPYGYPPFGNTLCLEQERQRGEFSHSYGMPQQQLPPSGQMQQNPGGAQFPYPQQYQPQQQPYRTYVPPDEYNVEPFRVGQ
jgi:hypothetical protein